MVEALWQTPVYLISVLDTSSLTSPNLETNPDGEIFKGVSAILFASNVRTSVFSLRLFRISIFVLRISNYHIGLVGFEPTACRRGDRSTQSD
ncbi:MAG: hypothetical protein DME85_08565 [Verrucomicrobia bacterium]|nr:MAG: hypothetical protein DME85_08565 [Verrucomicrobiota bacterium]